VSQIEGAIFDHEVFWISGLGALNTALLLALVVELARAFGAGMGWAWAKAGREVPVRTAASAICVLIALAAFRGTAQLRHVVRVSANSAEESVITRTLAGELEAYLKANHIERPLVRIDQDTWGIAAGVIVRLQRAGIELAVEDDWLPMFTPVFKSHGTEAAVLTIAGKAQHVRMEGTPGDLVIAARDPIYVHRSATAASPPTVP
jgi:hypothetical protein